MTKLANSRPKPWEAILALSGICLLLIGAYFIRRSALPKTDITLETGNCHTPATVFEPPAGVAPLGSAILVHGLAANRRTMEYLGTDFGGHGFRTYLLDLPGHGDNKDAFTFARAQECAEAAVGSLIAKKQIDPRKNVFLGHSMGGAIVIRMADRYPVAATIAISPAPMVNPTRMPGNLIVFSGEYDIWVMQQEAAALASAAGGERIASSDFQQQRAFELQKIPRATHTSPLIDHNVAHQTEEWAMRALFPEIASKTLALNLDLATYEAFDRGRRRLAGAVMGLIGLALLFPAGAALATMFTEAPQPGLPDAGTHQLNSRDVRPSRALAAAEGAVCALAAVLILAVAVPLRFVHLYQGDYLASLMLLAGAMLLGLNWKYAGSGFGRGTAGMFAASILGFATILAVGGWLNWQLADLWLNAPRWLRFAALLPVAWIFCFAEEVALGPPAVGEQRAWRFGIFLVLRLELWLACALAYYALASGQALILILVVSLAAFSVLQRLATDLVLRRTGSATAAATFGAILAAWFIAAVFPLT